MKPSNAARLFVAAGLTLAAVSAPVLADDTTSTPAAPYLGHMPWSRQNALYTNWCTDETRFLQTFPAGTVKTERAPEDYALAVVVAYGLPISVFAQVPRGSLVWADTDKSATVSPPDAHIGYIIFCKTPPPTPTPTPTSATPTVTPTVTPTPTAPVPTVQAPTPQVSPSPTATRIPLPLLPVDTPIKARRCTAKAEKRVTFWKTKLHRREGDPRTLRTKIRRYPNNCGHVTYLRCDPKTVRLLLLARHIAGESPPATTLRHYQPRCIARVKRGR